MDLWPSENFLPVYTMTPHTRIDRQRLSGSVHLNGHVRCSIKRAEHPSELVSHFPILIESTMNSYVTRRVLCLLCRVSSQSTWRRISNNEQDDVCDATPVNSGTIGQWDVKSNVPGSLINRDRA